MNEHTIEKMKTMKLYGMVRSFRTTLEAGNTEQYTADDELLGMSWGIRMGRPLQPKT